MNNARHHHSFRCSVAAQLVSNNDARSSSRGPQQLAKEPDGSKAISPGLYENVEHDTILIDSSPEIVSDAVDLEEHFIQMPLITGSSTSSSEAIGILFAEFVAPTPDRLVADEHSAGRHQFLHISKANTETEVEPNTF